MKYAYLLIDFFTVIVPFIFSFHPKLRFYQNWSAFFPAMVITGILFIVWDMYFADLGVWGFNANYVTGIYIGNLPIEEILFFFCIPYACVFTFHCLDIFITRSLPAMVESILTPVVILFLLLSGMLNFQKIYPLYTFTSLAIILAFSKYALRVQWLGKFYIIYTILLLPFLIVNGILTGTGLEDPIVWYNNDEISGLRILTIPVEDIFYGMELILVNLLIYHSLLRRRAMKKIWVNT